MSVNIDSVSYVIDDYHAHCVQMIGGFNKGQLCVYKKILRAVFQMFSEEWDENYPRRKVTLRQHAVFHSGLESNDFSILSMKYFMQTRIDQVLTKNGVEKILKEPILKPSDILNMLTACIQKTVGGNPCQALY